MKTRLIGGMLAALIGLGSTTVLAAEGEAVPEQDWSFGGIFGGFDRAAQQRGFQVYEEVCAGCHSLDLIAFRNLADMGFNEDEIKAIAAEYIIVDGPDDDGEMFEREGRPSDYFPAPFPNAKAAAAANNGAEPPDLSLLAKARNGGPDYLYALLVGYQEPPADFELLEGLSYNAYFPGHQIAMPPPLSEDGVEFADGTPATVEQMAADVSHFMMWAAEPSLEHRKAMGIKVMLFLIVFTALLYALKKRVWADLH
jgi:ubiquinol-cytochrome c reductase cytochrome c1 subunit